MVNLVEKLHGTKQIGTASIDGVEVPVEFNLQGRTTLLKLHRPGLGRNFVRQIDLIPVRMTDGICLTFINNILVRATNHHGGGGSVHEYMPAFVAVGRKLLQHDYRFNSISFSIDDAAAVFYDLDAFSVSVGAQDIIQQLLDRQQEQIGRVIRRGDDPIVAYFTGRHEICATSTVLGEFSVNHQPGYGMGSPRGVAIQNEIALRLKLETPAQVGGVIDKLMPILRFLQVVAGRKQKLERIHCSMDDSEPWNDLDLLWCLAWTRRDDAEADSSPSPFDLPLNGGIEPEIFTKVLASWLRVDGERRDARIRYSGVFAKGNAFDIERLVAAANMYDILPSICFAEPQELDEAVSAARDAALSQFKALPRSDSRDRAIGDLSRLGRHNLKSKVLQRAAILEKASGRKFPGLEFVLRKAIDSRNHYVHGSEATEARSSFFREMLSFHTTALEFVFGASDLIEAGWNYNGWATKGTTMSHPWAEFVANYSNNMREHEARVAALRNTPD